MTYYVYLNHKVMMIFTCTVIATSDYRNESPHISSNYFDNILEIQ